MFDFPIPTTKSFTEQNRLTACYTEVLQTLQFLKPSNYKRYQNSTEELEINNTAEDYQIDILIQSIKDLDVKLKEEHKSWKVLVEIFVILSV